MLGSHFILHSEGVLAITSITKNRHDDKKKLISNPACIPDPLVCIIRLSGLKTHPAGLESGCGSAKFKRGGSLDYVLEAECAVAGEPLALASATQILSVGALGVDVARRHCT